MDPDRLGITSPGTTKPADRHGHTKMCWARALATVRQGRGWEDFAVSRELAVGWLAKHPCDCARTVRRLAGS